MKAQEFVFVRYIQLVYGYERTPSCPMYPTIGNERDKKGRNALTPNNLFLFSDTELVRRKQLYDAGLKSTKRMCTSGNLAQASTTHGRRSSGDVEEIITTCDASKEICYLSLVSWHGYKYIHIKPKKTHKKCIIEPVSNGHTVNYTNIPYKDCDRSRYSTWTNMDG